MKDTGSCGTEGLIDKSLVNVLWFPEGAPELWSSAESRETRQVPGVEELQSKGSKIILNLYDTVLDRSLPTEKPRDTPPCAVQLIHICK